jgi:hypothetical protein
MASKEGSSVKTVITELVNIPDNQQIRTIDASVDMTERGSKLINDKSEVYTFGDFKKSVGAFGTVVLKLSQEGTAPPAITPVYNNTGLTFTSSYLSTGSYSISAVGLDYSNSTANIFNVSNLDVDVRSTVSVASINVVSATSGSLSNGIIVDAILEINVYA